ncbi:unnamed protein product [Brassica rapa]|uniref:Uncharacterized protein n=1 Tax=Brassica campestris TaxID=3711 RepID=A0A8D9DJ05_BRACM|nr:unnamed protein product [Brassica rapa]
MFVATMTITRSRFKLYGLERRRFGEFSEVTEESEFQNPAPVTKAINPSRRRGVGGGYGGGGRQ